jgi:hypothetical protein
MSAYEAKQMRAIAEAIANGERNHAWPWQSVVYSYLGAEQGFGAERHQCPHRVMACLLAALLAEKNRRGNVWDLYPRPRHAMNPPSNQLHGSEEKR